MCLNKLPLGFDRLLFSVLEIFEVKHKKKVDGVHTRPRSALITPYSPTGTLSYEYWWEMTMRILMCKSWCWMKIGLTVLLEPLSQSSRVLIQNDQIHKSHGTFTRIQWADWLTQSVTSLSRDVRAVLVIIIIITLFSQNTPLHTVSLFSIYPF